MRYSPKIEEDLGIEVYATSSDGIGGEIRQKYEDFLVKEIPMSAEQSQNESRNDMKADYSVFWLEKRGQKQSPPLRGLQGNCKLVRGDFPLLA